MSTIAKTSLHVGLFTGNITLEVAIEALFQSELSLRLRGCHDAQYQDCSILNTSSCRKQRQDGGLRQLWLDVRCMRITIQVASTAGLGRKAMAARTILFSQSSEACITR
jgi:hypothetical protein